MKKSKVTRSLLAACSIVALTAVMYGCSSNGPSQADLDAAEAAAAAAEAAAAAAAEAKAAAEQQAAALQTQINGLRMQLGLEADDDLGDDIADLQAEVERLQAALQARIAAAEAAAAAAASASAKELLNMALPDVNVDRDTDETGIQPAAPSVMLSVSNDGMLMAEATDYSQGMAPDMIEGWRGAMLMNMGGDTAVVYSDIGNDGTQTLLDRYASNLPGATSPRSWPVGGSEVTDLVDNAIPWSEVTRSDEMTTAGGPSSDPITMFEGAVHGIPGTFSCNAADVALCTAPERYSDNSVNDQTTGLPTTQAAAWSFVPDEGALTYTDDPNYLTLGWWLDYGPDGEPDTLRLISAATGHGEARTATSTAGTALRGSATYTGAAAGKYAIASLADDMHEGGHFTAMATLMADFDADDTPGDGANDRAGIALSGMIDNFMTGDMARPDWSVALMVDGDTAATAEGMQPINNIGSETGGELHPETATSALTTEWSTGGAQMGTGTWTATFYGPGVDAANTALPAVAIGTFNAHIGTADADAGAVGRIQGAFGVNKMDE